MGSIPVRVTKSRSSSDGLLFFADNILENLWKFLAIVKRGWYHRNKQKEIPRGGRKEGLKMWVILGIIAFFVGVFEVLLKGK